MSLCKIRHVIKRLNLKMSLAWCCGGGGTWKGKISRTHTVLKKLILGQKVFFCYTYLLCVVVLHRAALILLSLGPPLVRLAPPSCQMPTIVSRLLRGHSCALAPEPALCVRCHVQQGLSTPPALSLAVMRRERSGERRCCRRAQCWIEI